MKLSLFILSFLILLASSSLAQIDIQLLKEDYKAGEIFQAELQVFEAPLEELTLKNIKLFDKTGLEIKTGFILRPIRDNFYLLYSTLPSNLDDGTYNLSLVDLAYKPHNILVKKEVSKQFNITSNGTLISIDPIFFKLNPEELPEEVIIKVKNLDTITTSVGISSDADYLYPLRDAVSVFPGEEKRIFLRIEPLLFEEQDAVITLDYDRSYQVPFYIVKDAVPTPTPTSTPTPSSAEEGLIFSTGLTKIRRTLYSDESVEGPLVVQNILDQTVYDILIYLTGNLNEVISIEPNSISSLSSLESKTLTLIINPSEDALGGLYEGDLIVESGVYSDSLPVSITVEYLATPTPNLTPTATLTPEFSPTTEYSPSPTPEPEREFPTVILIITLIIIGVLILIYYMIKSQGKPKSFKEVIKSKKI